MFERFTDGARRVIVYAQEESRLRGDRHIGSEHLLLGLTFGPDDTSAALMAAGVERETARQRLRQTTPAGSWPATGHIPFTPNVKRALQEALNLANRLGQGEITPAHLLRGLLRIPDAGAVRLLLALGVDVDVLTARAETLAATNTPEQESGPPASTESRYVEVARSDSMASLLHERDRLRSALVRYGRHSDGCRPEQECTCGLADVLAENGNAEDA